MEVTTSTHVSTKAIVLGGSLGTLEDRERAQARPVDGPYSEYANEVRRLLGYYAGDRRPFLSLRMAEGKTGVKHTTIGTMARGFRADAYNTRRFAESLNGDPEKLLSLGGHILGAGDPLQRIGHEVNTSFLGHIPISLKTASAGRRIKGEDYADEEPVSSRLPTNTRGIEVEGDCMEPFFHNGDLLFIRPQSTAENGQKVVALLDDDSITCKVFRQNDDHPYLEATNGKYPRIDAGYFTIIGVVQKFMRDV